MVAPTCGSQRGGSCSVPSVSAGRYCTPLWIALFRALLGAGFRTSRAAYLLVRNARQERPRRSVPVQRPLPVACRVRVAEPEPNYPRRAATDRLSETTMSRASLSSCSYEQKPKTPDGRGESFLYCGLVNFVSWTGEKPITVVWSLAKPLPEPLWGEFGLASEVDKSQ